MVTGPFPVLTAAIWASTASVPTSLAPSIPLSTLAMCMEPPLPLHDPDALPMNSAPRPALSTPLAMQWPRCVVVMSSLSVR
jgi:hypothetical protein